MKNFNFHIFVLITLFVIPLIMFPGTHHDWTYNQNIYEVNIRQYTESGTFDEFSGHLDRLQKLGVGILWLMPIHPIGEKNRLGSLGSYYSVKNYYGVNSEFGNMQDFQNLVDEAHKRGMYVIMDWVANHTSWDNELTKTHPEWYNKDDDGNFISPPGTNWSDVIDLDYTQQGLRDYMVEVMKFWIDTAHIDGFRCDAAGMVPMDFWEEAIAELKQHKSDLFMLAEGDNPDLQKAGFDMTYSWGLYGFGQGVLMGIVDDTRNTDDLHDYLSAEKALYNADHYRMYFTSNHDENSWHGTVFERFGEAAETFAVLTLTLDGMPLIYSGQEIGLDKSLEFFNKDQISWKEHEFVEIYSKLLKLKKSNQALWNGRSGGALQRISTTLDQDVFAFIREKNDDKILVIINLSPNNQTPIFLNPEISGIYRDLFIDDTLSFQQGSNLNLTGWEYRVYELVEKTNSISTEKKQLKGYELLQNYPNPFNPETTIKYILPERSYVELAVFNLNGKKVETLVAAIKNAGIYSKTFRVDNLSSGIYFYKLKAGGFQQTKCMLLLK